MAQYQVDDIVIVYIPTDDRTITTPITTVVLDAGNDDEEISVYAVMDHPNGLIEITDDDIVELVSGPTLNERRRQRDLAFFSNTATNREQIGITNNNPIAANLAPSRPGRSTMTWTTSSLPSATVQDLTELRRPPSPEDPLDDEQFIAPAPTEVRTHVRSTPQIIADNPSLNPSERGIGANESRRRRVEIERLRLTDQIQIQETTHRQPVSNSQGLYEQLHQAASRPIDPRSAMANQFTSTSSFTFRDVSSRIDDYLVRDTIPPPPTRPTAVLPPVVNLENLMTGPEQNVGLTPISQFDYTPTTSSSRVVNFAVINRSLFTRGQRPARGIGLSLTPTLRQGDNAIIWVSGDGTVFINSIQNRNVERIQDPEGVLTYFDAVRIIWTRQTTLANQLQRGLIDISSKKGDKFRKKLKHKYGNMPVVKSEDHYAGKNFIA